MDTASYVYGILPSKYSRLPIDLKLVYRGDLVGWFAGLTVIIALRVKREESMMADRFGDAYRQYMRRTGRFVPAIRANKTPAGMANNPHSYRVKTKDLRMK